jgi:hypothetical protein
VRSLNALKGNGVSRQPPVIRRLCFVVDLVGSSRRTHPEQYRDQARLRAAVDRALTAAGCERAACFQQDRGDGELLLLPPGLDESRAVPGLVLGLLDAVSADNAAVGAPIRVRGALAEGAVQASPTGYVGRAVVEACRLVDSPELKSELARAATGEVAFAVSGGLYDDVVRHNHGDLSAGGFRRTRIAALAASPDPYGWFWIAGDLALDPVPAPAPIPASIPQHRDDASIPQHRDDASIPQHRDDASIPQHRDDVEAVVSDDIDFDDEHESEDGLRFAG